jgi:hypothetical protein
MTTEELRTELKAIIDTCQQSKMTVNRTALLGRLMSLSGHLENEDVEVPADIFECLDNEGRRLCLTALLTIFGAVIGQR